MKEIYAKDAIVGKVYLIYGTENRVRLAKINTLVNSKNEAVVSSVSVMDSRYSSPILIAGDTLFVEEENGESLFVRESMRGKTVKLTRSKVIDRYLSHFPSQVEPDWKHIVTEVIAAGLASSEDLEEEKKIQSQAKERWRWYKKGVKINPELSNLR